MFRVEHYHHMENKIISKADRLKNIIDPEFEKKKKINNFFDTLQDILETTNIEDEKTPDETGVFYCQMVLVEIIYFIIKYLKCWRLYHER